MDKFYTNVINVGIVKHNNGTRENNFPMVKAIPESYKHVNCAELPLTG